MGIKDIDINKDRVTLGDERKSIYLWNLRILRDSIFFPEDFQIFFSTDQHDIFKCPVMDILKTSDLFTGADAAFDDRSFTLTVI